MIIMNNRIDLVSRIKKGWMLFEKEGSAIEDLITAKDPKLIEGERPVAIFQYSFNIIIEV